MTFDIDQALAEIQRHRAAGGPLIQKTDMIAEKIVAGFRGDFAGVLDLDTCGRALVVAAASLVPLCSPETPGAVLVNMIGMAGESLIRGEGR